MVLVLHIDLQRVDAQCTNINCRLSVLRDSLICVDAKLGEKIDIQGPTSSRLVVFIVRVLEIKIIFNLS